MTKLIKLEKISLAAHSEINEKLIQEKIVEDPSILDLGDLVVRDKERLQPKGGRLDLLLEDPETGKRYEVEIQLGKTDENHIIRTLEYWDVERKRYPQYEHTAVIVAEDITSRFSNIIGLFNGYIPLIAIQLSAFKHGDDIALVATTILDEMSLGLDEEDEVREPTDRKYWVNRGSEDTVKMGEDILAIINEISPGHSLNYNKHHVGLIKDGRASNKIIVVKPRRHDLFMELKIPYSDEVKERIENAGIDVMGYEKRYNGFFKLHLNKSDIKKNHDLLKGLFQQAFENSK